MKKIKIKIKQENKILIILVSIIVICFISIGLLFYKYFYAGTSKTKYGNRLEGIENHELSSTIEKDIQDVYKEEDKIKEVIVNVEGKIIYITIDYKENIKTEKAEELAVKALEKIEEDDLSYYDIQFLLTYSDNEEEDSNFPIFGSKNSNSLKVVWTVSK